MTLPHFRFSTIQNFLLLLTFFLSSTTKVVTSSSYAPPARRLCSAVLAKDKVYFMGGTSSGANDGGQIFGDFFYLDLSTGFDVNSPQSFQLVTGNLTSPFTGLVGASSVASNDSIYWFGGTTTFSDTDIAGKLYTVNISSTSQTWTSLTPQGPSPTPRWQYGSTFSSSTGKWYIYGGYDKINSTAKPIGDTALYIYDVDQSVWTKKSFNTTSSSNSTTLPGAGFTATLLNDGRIVFLGGTIADGSRLANLSEIWTYDTNKDEWELKIAQGGNDIQPRASHSASLTSDGRIIVFGGSSSPNLTSANALYVLDTQTFTWSHPNASLTLNDVPFQHDAIIYNNYLIVTFGALRANDTASLTTTDKLLILDVTTNNNITSVSTFSPQNASNGTNTNSNNSSQGAPSIGSIGLVIGLVVGGFWFCVLACGVTYFVRTKRRRAEWEAHHRKMKEQRKKAIFREENKETDRNEVDVEKATAAAT